MVNNGLHKMAQEAIDLGSVKDLQIESQNIFPSVDGQAVKFCPMVQPTALQMRAGGSAIKIVHLYHPCLKECQLYDEKLKAQTGSPCSLAIPG